MKLFRTDKLSKVGVSHNPQIKKKVIIQKGIIPSIGGFSQAIFKPKQRVEKHSHENIYEVFYILSGEGIFEVRDKSYILKKNDCLIVEPGEIHSQKNNSKKELVFLYMGVDNGN